METIKESVSDVVRDNPLTVLGAFAGLIVVILIAIWYFSKETLTTGRRKKKDGGLMSEEDELDELIKSVHDKQQLKKKQ